MKIKYSDNYKAKRSRIQRLPKMAHNAMVGFTKRDILTVNKLFHDGIKNDTLNLERLSDLTIKGKVSKRYPKPNTPLYGKGDESKDRSYMNMMNVRRITNGWVLEPSKRMHHSGNLTLDHLFAIHEHGAIIKMNTKEGPKLIRIPPRPALMLAHRRWLIIKRRDKKEQSKEVRQAMTDYINTGNKDKFDDWASLNTKLNTKSEELF